MQMLFKINKAVKANTSGKHTDYNAVQVAVLKSKPKNQDDVPMQVDWYKKIRGRNQVACRK